jgi:hypothetical protein
MNTNINVFVQIIKEQKAVIGPLANQLAHNVQGIRFGQDDEINQIDGDTKSVLHELVAAYAQLFGQASIEICKDAVHSITPPVAPDMLPDELK